MKSLLCFSHLDWRFVYQRPQHLLTRFASKYKVYYFEEPKPSDANKLESEKIDKITVVKIFFDQNGFNAQKTEQMLSKFLREEAIDTYDCWYYTPMALDYTHNLTPEILIFDSMDELSAFKFAPKDLLTKEEELLRMADIVFTGGNSLYNAKKHRHHNIHPFPSSIDKEHFYQAREDGDEPEDQQHIGRPRFGFYGVIDERFNIALLRDISAKRPDWNFIIIGPVVKISPDELPKADNIFYLGPKNYDELPHYIRHWDIAMNMFALNESTKYISPTKTPEYLSAGLPVISTSITDVVEPYGEMKLVDIADEAETFISIAEEILNERDNGQWLENVDKFLADKSWDHTHMEMQSLINKLK